MKYSISLIFAALVYGLEEPQEVSATDELCNVKAKVFSVFPKFANKMGQVALLKTERSVIECEKWSGAKVFRKVYIDASSASSSKKQQFDGGSIAVESVDFLYGDEGTKFYSGFEFDIEDLNKTVVERLVKERSDDQMFSLRMTLDKWHEVGTVVNKYAAKVNYVILEVGVDPHGFVTFEDIVEKYPKITFSATNEHHESVIMSLVKKYSRKINRKVGYTNYRPNARQVDITYTAGI
ncbi:hypothetical protein DSO57_1008324 [Entomophthora muscae]|uniref:Uncharacterized protein n=1 Tax=Entomophthora muscae TaxID=34485 RepID=A0ACC2RLU5_9FUNG|nr:hypothetical protein DSO57_1008324 [Entomophthora muscae]